MDLTQLSKDLGELARLVGTYPEVFQQADVQIDFRKPKLYVSAFVYIPSEASMWVKALLDGAISPLRKKAGGNDFELVRELSSHSRIVVCISKVATGCKRVKVMREIEEWDCPDSILQNLLGEAQE